MYFCCMEELFKELNIDSEHKIKVLNKIITIFQIEILQEVDREGEVKKKIKHLESFLS